MFIMKEAVSHWVCSVVSNIRLQCYTHLLVNEPHWIQQDLFFNKGTANIQCSVVGRVTNWDSEDMGSSPGSAKTIIEKLELLKPLLKYVTYLGKTVPTRWDIKHTKVQLLLRRILLLIVGKSTYLI